MSLAITLNHLKGDFTFFLCEKFKVSNIYEINEILTNNQGQFKIGTIPFDKDTIEKINYPIKKPVEKNKLCVTLHELKDSFITFLRVKYNVVSIYDLEVIFSKYQPENDGIFIIGKIPLTNNGDNEMKEVPKLVKVLENVEVNSPIKDDEINLENIDVNPPIENNYCIIENKIEKKEIIFQVNEADEQKYKKTSKTQFILQKYGKGIFLKCLSVENPFYQKNWSSLFPDFDDSNGGWWKNKGSLKKKSLEGWFFKIEYLPELLSQKLDIICDGLEEITNDKKENQKKKMKKNKL